MKSKSILLFATIALLLSGCAVSNYKFASTDQNLSIESESLKELSKRHLEFWEFYSAKDFDSSYSYELPYLRFLKPLEWYKNFNAPNRKNYKIKQLSIKEIDEGRAVVIHQYSDKEGNTHEIEDRWVLVGGRWYHYFEFSKLPDIHKPF